MQIIVNNVTDFNLKYTLESGQSFRWNWVDDAYFGVVQGQILKIQQNNDTLIVHSSYDKDAASFSSHLHHYLDLHRDLAEILNAVNVDAYIDRAIKMFWGMRILNQELWEIIASFILSQNNNIARIRNIIQTISHRYGRKLEYEDYVDYTFPKPQTLTDAGINEIFECGTGYRASYLWNAAKNIENGQLSLDALKLMDYDSAKKELMKLEGVGEKVADCICLFSLEHLQALPIDVWIKRIFERVYLRKSAKPQEIQDFAKNYFGEFVGYAQQYLFHYAQQKPDWDNEEHLTLPFKQR